LPDVPDVPFEEGAPISPQAVGFSAADAAGAADALPQLQLPLLSMALEFVHGRTRIFLARAEAGGSGTAETDCVCAEETRGSGWKTVGTAMWHLRAIFPIL
jgi:hypothetical protein